jgi:hypothetical protein
MPDERVSFNAAQRSMAEVRATQSASRGRNVNGGAQLVSPGHGRAQFGQKR